MPIDFHCNLFTPESIKKNWYDAPEMYRLIKWWKMEDRVKGKTVEEFVKLLDDAGCDKVMVPAIRMFSYKRKVMVWDISEEEVLEAVKSSGDRIIGLAGYNPFNGMDSVRQVEKANGETAVGERTRPDSPVSPGLAAPRRLTARLAKPD